MLQNRAIWQSLLFSSAIEGEWSAPRLGDLNPTMFGVTFATFQASRAPAVVTIDDLKAITIEDAKVICNQSFWLPVQGDKLTGGIDVAVADTSFNSGPRQATKLLQRCLGFDEKDVDGFLGVKTLQAVEKSDPQQLVRDYHDARMMFLKGLKTWPQNGKGWTARVRAVTDLAITLAPPTAPAVVARNDGTRRWVASALSIGSLSVTALLPDLIAGVASGVGPARAAYQATAELLEPFSFSTLIVPVVGGVGILATLFLHVRAARMSHNASQAGNVAQVVAS